MDAAPDVQAHMYTKDAYVPLLQSQPNIERESSASPTVALVCDMQVTATLPNADARQSFVPKNTKLVAAANKWTKDFKSACSTYLRLYSLKSGGEEKQGAAPSSGLERAIQEILNNKPS